MNSRFRVSTSAFCVAALIIGTPALAQKGKRKPVAKPAAAAPAPVDPGPSALYRPTVGCPVAPAGKFAAAVAVPKKERGKSPIEKAPLIATVSPADICANRTRMVQGGSQIGSTALGLSSQVLNTQAGRLDLLEIPKVEHQLQKVLLKYSDAWPYARPAKLPRILFRATDAYDAYALADDNIVISLGAIEAAESDSELLFILAHEYGHVLMAHHGAQAQTGNTKSAFAALGALYTAGTLVSQLRSNGASVTIENRAKVENAAKRAAIVTEALRFAVDDVWAPAYSRDQEYQADAIAMDLLIGSNQTIDSYANVFARLGKMFDKKAASRDRAQKRASALQKSLESTMKEVATPEFFASVGMGNTQGLKNLGTNMALGIGASLLGGIMGKAAGDTHPPPEERRKALAAYYQAGYPTVDPPIDAGVMVGLIKGMPEFKNALAMRTTYLAARDAYSMQNFTGAMTGLRSLGAGTRTAPTFINFMAGVVARDMGDTATANLMFEAGRGGTGIPSAQLHETYAELNITNRDTNRARVILDDANARYRDPDHFRSVEISRYVAAGDITAAQANYNQCLTITNREYIPPRCKAAYPQGDPAAAQPEKKKFKIPGLPTPF
jgi:beta-barrel assembly-enhancing protease